MTRRRWTWLLGVPLAVLLGLLVMAGLASWWVLDTPAGARWALAKATDARPGLIRADHYEGTLRGGLEVRGLAIQGDSYRIEAESLHARARPGVLPWAVALDELAAHGVQVTITSDDASPPLSPGDALSKLPLPFHLIVRDASLRDVSISRDGASWLEGADIDLSGRWSDRLQDLNARIAAGDWTAQLSGDLSFGAPWNVDLDGGLTWQDALAPAGEAHFALAGDGDGVELSSTVPGLGLSANGQVTDWLDQPRLALVVDGGQYAWQEPGSGIRVHGLSVALDGEPVDYEWKLSGLLEWPQVGNSPFSASGDGDLDALDIRAIELGPGPLELTGSGTWSWSPELRLDADLDVERLAVDAWWEGWPGQHPLTGQASLDWTPEGIDVLVIDLDLEGGGVRIDGHLRQSDPGDLTAEVNWEGAHWPVGSGEPLIVSREGHARLRGTLDEWTTEGELLVQAGDYPQGVLPFRARGDRNEALVNILRGSIAGGTLTGTLRGEWLDGFGWSAFVQAWDVDTGTLWPDWPARVNAQLALTQRAGEEAIGIQIEEGSVSMRGRTVTARGGLSIDDDAVRFSRLELTEEGSRATLDGGWDARSLLSFEVDVHRPGLMADLAGAELSGRGRLGIRADRPVFEGGLSGTAADWGDWRADRFSITGDPGQGDARVQAVIEGLLQDDWLLPRAELTLSGPWDDQALTATVTFGEELALDEAVLQGRGQWRQWRDPARLSWAGSMTGLDLREGGASLLALEQPVALVLGMPEVSLGEACFAAPGGGRLCGQGAWRAGEALQLSGELREWPLARLLGPFTPGIDYSQLLGGRLDWQHRPGGRPSGNADLTLSAGRFGPADDEEARVDTSVGRFGFAMEDGQLHSGMLALAFGDQGDIDIDWGIEDVVLDGSGRLSGQARINGLDLSVLNSLWPDVDRIGGRFDANLQLGGRVADPNFQGRFTLRGARFDYATLGMALKNLELEGTVTSSDQLRFRGPFSMGEGVGQLDGQLDFSNLADPAFSVQVTGNRLRIADLPTLQVDADPDLQFGGRGAQYRITGEVTIPHARIAPNGTILSRVSESEDVVITAGALPDEAPAIEPVQANLGGRLAVRLGDDVRLMMDAVDTRLTGEVVLRWPQSLMPTADGQVFVNGDVRVFGPLLHINNGRVRFNGGPADNPQLSIRAARDVFGNTQVQTAGVLVSGTARSPDIQAYTDPLTTSERAWGLLITGQDFEYGQGVGAFDIGTYIAPRLYLSYGVSLLDEGNVVSLRYDLRRGFGVKATSSQTENGLDISYTLNRGSTEPEDDPPRGP